MISHLIICHKQTLEFSSCIEPIPEIEGKCPGDECNQTLFNNGILREAKFIPIIVETWWSRIQDAVVNPFINQIPVSWVL